MAIYLTSLDPQLLPEELARVAREQAVVTLEQALDMLDQWLHYGLPDGLHEAISQKELVELRSRLQEQLASGHSSKHAVVLPRDAHPMNGVLSPENKPRADTVKGVTILRDAPSTDPEEDGS